MTFSKHSILLTAVFAALLILGICASYWWQNGDALSVQPQSGQQEASKDSTDCGLGFLFPPFC
jgi:hypothetical protein